MNKSLKIFVGSVCAVLGASIAYKLYSNKNTKKEDKAYKVTKDYVNHHSGDNYMEKPLIIETEDAITFVKK